MSTVAQAITFARQKAQTDSNGISDTNGLAWANDALLDATRILFTRDIDAAQTKEAYATISASDNPPGRFAWPTDMFALKTVEVDFTSSGGQNYLQAQPIEVANIQFVSWDWLRLNQSTAQPLFDNRGNTAEVFPTPTGTALVRIFYFLQPTEYTTTSDTIAYPFALDYRLIGDKIVTSYFESLGDKKMKQAQASQARYEKRLNDLVQILAPSSQQPIQAQPISISGWQF